MKTTLMIMAAGLGSRYGGIKQLASADARGHVIMDYSIHDAIAAGFGKIVIILRREIEADFRRIIGERIKAVCGENGVEIAYAFQSMEDLPEGYVLPEGRKKPWGTGHAVLSAKEHICGPFAVINADDYYGREAFRDMYRFLARESRDDRFCMAGFVLENTLSENGGVTRGICRVNENRELVSITETGGIVKTDDGIRAGEMLLNGKTTVSMNMWGLTKRFCDMLEAGFREFLETEAAEAPLKAEFLLPVFVESLLEKKMVTVKVLNTGDRWFGVTYREDIAGVAENFRRLMEAGVYREDLYSDL